MAAPMHTRPIFNTQKRREILLWITDQLRDLNPQAIVVCGQSGIILGSLVSDRLNIPLVVVRKKEEMSSVVAGGENARKVNWDGDLCYDRWVFLDDCIGTGGTFYRTASQAVEYKAVSTRIPAAIVLYGASRTSFAAYNYNFLDPHEKNPDETHDIPVISKDFCD